LVLSLQLFNLSHFTLLAEALGAIASPDTISILEKFKSDPVIEVAETCQLALDRVKWLNSSQNEKLSVKSPYNSVDPAPPATSTNVAELKSTLLDENASLFERYRAMFSLRNLKSKEAVVALGAALKCGSALFRHEIAFVLGQMQDQEGVPFLKESLEDCGENEMVRHECAEALGAIATDDCITILNKYLEDSKRVVKESCEIALDMCEYENSPEFQYANTLQAS
jgi:deoxyhypusine monooxygenase